MGENKEKALGETLPESLSAEKEGIVSCTQHPILLVVSLLCRDFGEKQAILGVEIVSKRAGRVLGNKVYSLFIV
ncbi:MAG: hypothetical protein IJW99_05105 [Clostridia bacterium]|nr:hypothetical protein [Clostridia bacterium]